MSARLLTPEMAHMLQEASLTYPEVGATARELPEGYAHLRRARVVGSGPSDFAKAHRALLGWQMHQLAGVPVQASDPVAEAGTVVLMEAGIRPFQVSAACRVVYRIDEPQRQGFAYGTLPGHPESGEEAFVLRLCGDGRVIFAVTAFSRPATALARVAGPVGGLMQRYVTARYLRALSRR